MELYVQRPSHFPGMVFENYLINNDLCSGIFQSQSVTVGPLFIAFPSAERRLEGDMEDVMLYIEKHPNCRTSHQVVSWPSPLPCLVCYHRGNFDTIGETYEKMYQWAMERNINLKANSIERYVIDYWSTKSPKWFLTEVFLPIS